jgi:hypothetical protein
MTNPIKVIHNVTTGEIIEREFTAAELKQWEKDQTEEAVKQAEAEAKALARQAVLNKLGLTAEEVTALLT